ncbi:hypothetical protein U9M48_023381 [Paspalum notatum var. saurae]|uniref:Uncharacterized protein n=1 Tax=Paspalum notatum var. saurae TaxID=547442 RepID=A0AAQ3WVX7_PASNO
MDMLSKTSKVKQRPKAMRVAMFAGQEARDTTAKTKDGGGGAVKTRRAAGPTHSGPSGNEKSEVAAVPGEGGGRRQWPRAVAGRWLPWKAWCGGRSM